MWGKIIGGVAGFAMGGPFGAVVGAALGHAADSGSLPRGFSIPGIPGMAGMGATRTAALTGKRDQLFAVGVVVLAAKLAKCDGPVRRAEIDGFKRGFRIPPEAVRDIGRLFDHARDSDDDPFEAAGQLGAAFADNLGMLEDVLAALFTIARADGPLNKLEEQFLRRVWLRFALDEDAWNRAHDARPRPPPRGQGEDDPYVVLGVTRGTADEDIRLAWRKLMRENHPDSLASRGVPAEFIARASDKVARINAAWDRIKRERAL